MGAPRLQLGPAEERVLVELWAEGLRGDVLAAALGYGRATVQRFARERGLAKTLAPDWSALEDAILVDGAGRVRDRALVERLPGRTLGAVRARAKLLGLRLGVRRQPDRLEGDQAAERPGEPGARPARSKLRNPVAVHLRPSPP